jgi:hypothetical protein
MRGPRITKAEHDNYQFFVRTMAQNRIPCILVLTGCENVEPMSKWAAENKGAFDRENLPFKEIVAACFAAGGRLDPAYAPLREESCEGVTNAIERHATLLPVRMYETSSGLWSTPKRAWNWFCRWLGLDQWVIIANKALHQLLIRMGLNEHEAMQFADELDTE